MIIAIDGYEANVATRVGIGRYAYEILCHIYALVAKDKETKPRNGKSGLIFRIYLPNRPRPDMPKETYWWQYRVTKPKKFWTMIGLPLRLFLDQPRADVMFSPTHYIPRYTTIPRVMSIMDLSYLFYPELFKKKDLHQLVHWTKHSASYAKKIFTISEFSKNAIIQAYQRTPDDVIVTHLGLIMATNSEDTKPIKGKYPISKHYILSVGTVQPRKNYGRLIEAFALFLKKNKQKFGAIDLVIVGKKGWLYEEILKAPARFGIEGQVKFLNFVPDEDLPGLYANALCFALPSLYEGFGLPVLEAMAHGCPVVVSNSSSLPEIAGKAGVYVDPENVESIADGLLSAVRERNLIQGRSRIKKGLEQVKHFTWEKAAEQTLAVLEDVGNKSKMKE